MSRLFSILVCLFLSIFSTIALADKTPVRIASKNFTESYVLAEIMAQLLESKNFVVERRFGLGGTMVCYEALRSDEIDVYPEYTGTVSQAILKQSNNKMPDIISLNRELSAEGVRLLESMGFNNTYAMAIKSSLAESKGLKTVSDLADHKELRYAFSLEFLNRHDGWPGLKQRYHLDAKPRGIEHGLAYKAMDLGEIDITDAYSTDGDLARYQLTTLIDDKGYFPQYLAAPLIGSNLSPEAGAVLKLLVGQIDSDTMRALNGQVVVDGLSFTEVASQFLFNTGLVDKTEARSFSIWPKMLDNVLRHLQLTIIALGLGCVFGLGIGLLVFRHAGLSRVMLYVSGLMQTIPSIALLALMIPLFGIGTVPAIIALLLYSILPILRNTITALVGIDPLLKRVSEAMGLSTQQQVRYVFLPLAMPTILAGIKTAAVISIGTATLAAFIGAGGLGEPIVTGLALNDTSLILQGALPAAGLAILVELFFELLERLIVKPHMLSGQLPV